MRPADVIMLVVVGTIILVSLIIYGNLQTLAANLDLGVAGNASRELLFTNIWASMNLASIGLIIIAAMGIIGVILAVLGGMGGGAKL